MCCQKTPSQQTTYEWRIYLLLSSFSAVAPPAPSPGPTHTEPTSQPSMSLWDAAGTFCIHTVSRQCNVCVCVLCGLMPMHGYQYMEQNGLLVCTY